MKLYIRCTGCLEHTCLILQCDSYAHLNLILVFYHFILLQNIINVLIFSALRFSKNTHTYSSIKKKIKNKKHKNRVNMEKSYVNYHVFL